MPRGQFPVMTTAKAEYLNEKNDALLESCKKGPVHEFGEDPWVRNRLVCKCGAWAWPRDVRFYKLGLFHKYNQIREE